MANQRLIPIYGFQQEDASLQLLSDQLSSMNFDGAIKRVYAQKAVSSVKAGDAIHFSSSQQDEVVPVLVSSVELNDSEDPLYTSPVYFIYYIDRDGRDQAYTIGSVTTDGGYLGTELVYTSYEDPTTIDVGTSGWTITKYGNAVFSNVFTRGTIEATAGKIDGILTIGADENTAIQLGKGISIPGDTSIYNGLVINDTNYFVTKELASSTYTISSATTTTETGSSGLSLVTFTINSHGLFTNATGSKIVRLFGFSGGLASLNNSWNLNTSSTNTITVIVPRITAGTYTSLTAQLEQDGIAIRKDITSAAISDIADVTNTNITFTTSANHNFVANNSVSISGLPANLENINGTSTVFSVTANTFTIKNVTVTGTSPYTGLSGSVFKLFNTERSVFNVGSGTNFMNYDSDTDLLEVTGKIVSSSGSIGGWSLSANEFFSGSGSSRVSLNSLTGVIAVGPGNHGSIDTGFYADKDGKFSLSNQLIFTPVLAAGRANLSTTGTFATGTPTTITVASATGLGKGMTVTGTGIDSGTTVTDVVGTTVTISKNVLSSQTATPLSFILDDMSELSVTGRIKGIIDSVTPITSPRLSATITNANITGTSPNQTATFTTNGHAFLSNEKIYIEGLPGTNGLSNLNNREYVLSTVPDSITFTVSLSGITGITTSTNASLSSTVSLRELTMGLHPAEGVSGTDSWYHSAGTGVRLDKFNYWLTNNQLRVGTLGSYFKWNGSKFIIQGSGTKTLSFNVGSLDADNVLSIVNNGSTPTYNTSTTPFYVDGSGKFSLGQKLLWDAATSTLSIDGTVTIGGTPGSTVASNASAGVAKPDVYRQASAPSSLVVGGSTSTTSVQTITYGTGNKNFGNIGNIGSFVVGNRVRAVNLGDPTNLWLEGSLTAIVNVAPDLWYFSVNVDSFSGTGSVTSSWNIRLVTSGVAINSGSVWYDTDDNNKTYVFDGTIWAATETNATGVGLGNVSNLTPQNQAQTGLIAGTTITGGGITLSSGGNIKGGQTAFNTGSGFFLGYESSQYKFSIGNSSGSNLTWDGSNLSVTGNISGSTISGGTISIGSGNSIFKADASGIYLGNGTFANANFSVSPNGTFNAGSPNSFGYGARLTNFLDHYSNGSPGAIPFDSGTMQLWSSSFSAFITERRTGSITARNQFYNAVYGVTDTYSGYINLDWDRRDTWRIGSNLYVPGTITTASIVANTVIANGTGSGTSKFQTIDMDGHIYGSGVMYNEVVAGRALRIAGSPYIFGTSSSSRRVKSYIDPIELTDELISTYLQIQPVSYFYNSAIEGIPEIELEGRVREIGLIAEDLQDLGLSSLINLDDEGIADYVHYDKLSIYNIKMIQMQQERINQLENRLAALES